MESTVTVKAIRQTVPYEKLARLASEIPFVSFDEWPILEIRDKAVDAIEGRGIFAEDIKWVEERIRNLINEENVSRKLVVKLLDCYLFRTHDTHIPGAVEFAIGLFMNPGSLRQRLFAEDIIKSAINRGIRNPFLYWQVPSMHNFLSVLIKSLGAYGNYTDSEWVDVERALRAIIKAEDIQFIPLLRNTLEAFKDRR